MSNSEKDRLGAHLFTRAAMQETRAPNPTKLSHEIGRRSAEEPSRQWQNENPDRACREWFRGRNVPSDNTINTISSVIARRTHQDAEHVHSRLQTARAGGGLLLSLDPSDESGELAVMLANEHLNLIQPRPLDAARSLSDAGAPSAVCLAAWLSCFMLTQRCVDDVFSGGVGGLDELVARALSHATEYLDQAEMPPSPSSLNQPGRTKPEPITADQLLASLHKVVTDDPHRETQQRLLSELIASRAAG